MAKTRTYEKIEKNILKKTGKGFNKFFSAIGTGIRKFFKLCDSKITIMIVPHSQTNVLNFRTNIFSLVFGCVITIGVLFSFFYFNRQNALSTSEIARLEEENSENLASFDILKDENNNLLQAAEKFKTALNESLSLIGIDVATGTSNSQDDSDLSSFVNNNSLSAGSSKEIADVQELTSYIEGTVEPIEQIGEVIKSQQSLFSDVPNIWPLKYGAGYTTFEFGHAIHPISGKWYIHTGYDIANGGRTGDPIVATANGKIIKNTYNESLGIHVAIQHKYGYVTRYAHMDASYVTLGQEVQQGEVIGTLGNTGLTTGAHLHYEVYIGSSIVDPAPFINIR